MVGAEDGAGSWISESPSHGNLPVSHGISLLVHLIAGVKGLVRQPPAGKWLVPLRARWRPPNAVHCTPYQVLTPSTDH